MHEICGIFTGDKSDRFASKVSVEVPKLRESNRIAFVPFNQKSDMILTSGSMSGESISYPA